MKLEQLFEADKEDWSIVAHHDDDEEDYLYKSIPDQATAKKVATGYAKWNFDEYYKGKDGYTLDGTTIKHNNGVVTSLKVISTDDVDVGSRMGSPTSDWKQYLK